MTNRYRAIATVVALGILVLALWAMFHTVAQCNAIGGTTVRGLFWLECIH